MEQRWAQLLLAAKSFYGLVTLRQAEALGISRQALAHALHREGWVRVCPGVYLAPGFSLSPRVRAAAVDLAVTGLAEDPPLGAVSHRTAAALHGLTASVRTPIDYTAHINCSKRPPQARVRRARWLSEAMIGTVSGIHVLHPEPMFGTLASCCEVPELSSFLRKAHQLRVSTPTKVRRWLASAPNLPRLTRLFRALDEVEQELTHSDDEQLARKHLRQAGLVPAQTPVLVHDDRGPVAEVDIAFVDEKVAVPIDGPHHDDADQRRFDDDQRLRLQMLGWLIVRADLHRVRYQPEAFVSQVRAALAHRGRSD